MQRKIAAEQTAGFASSPTPNIKTPPVVRIQQGQMRVVGIREVVYVLVNRKSHESMRAATVQMRAQLMDRIAEKVRRGARLERQNDRKDTPDRG
jgi:hypothetical protein